jgi:hypothetical protein
MSVVSSYSLKTEPSVVGTSVIDAQVVAEFGVSMEGGFQSPVIAKPSVSDRATPFRIANIEAMQEDALHFHFSDRPSDPMFLVITPTNDLMKNADIVTDRNCLRKLLNVVSSGPPDPFYCKKQSFTILVERVAGKLILQRQHEGRATWEPVPGGYGEGFEKAMICSTVSKVNISDFSYYRVASYVLCGLKFLVRHEVDCISSDARQSSIELKSKKGKINKRTGAFFELNQDFYHDVWGQLVLSGTKMLKVGMHADGKVTSLLTLSSAEVAQKAGVDKTYSDSNMRKMTNVLRWIRTNLPDGQQGLVSFVEGQKSLTLTLLSESEKYPCLSEEIRAQLVEST